MSTETSLGIVAICQLIMTIAILVGTAGVIIAIFLFKKTIGAKLDELLCRIEPILEQTKEIAEHAKETSEKLNTTVESILSKADNTADRLSSQVGVVADKVAQVVSPQAATVATYATAAVKGFQLIQQVIAARRAAASQADVQPEPEPEEA